MSAASHDAVAGQHERQADVHQAQYDPSARKSYRRCSGEIGPCWTSIRNPTAEHENEAEQHRRAAAEHRTASAALRAAEAKACAGIAPDDRDASPFTHVEDIASVEPIKLDRGVPAVSRGVTVGAVITFRAVPGFTAEGLQRLLDCHLARNGALGHVVPDMPDCPLVPSGVEAHVAATKAGLEVELRANDEQSARDVLARAERLVAPGVRHSGPVHRSAP